MDWEVRLSNRAKRALEELPARDQARVARALLDIKRDPYAGDTKPLRGHHQRTFRRRVGSWRIIFVIKPELRAVLVVDVTRRTANTY